MDENCIMFSLSAQNIHRAFMFESLHFRFLLSALNTAKRDRNIVLGYTLEVTCTHNHFFAEKMKKKIKYIPVSLSLTI